MVLPLLVLAACSKEPEVDLPSIGEARSIVAEWALVNEQVAQGRLNATYVQSMRKQLREQLRTTAKSLKQPDSIYASEIQACLKLSDDALPAELRAHSQRLKQIEDSLESA